MSPVRLAAVITTTNAIPATTTRAAAPPRIAALLASLRSCGPPDHEALHDVADAAKQWPAHACALLHALTRLLKHEDQATAERATSACLEFLDVAVALPSAVIDELLPALATLFEHAVLGWSWQASMYRFARFAALRPLVIDAALAFARTPRAMNDPATATMQLQDVVIGLQRANAFDEPPVTEAFAAFIVGQTNDSVRRAVFTFLLTSAPPVAAAALATDPALFPSVEALHRLPSPLTDDECEPTLNRYSDTQRVDALALAAPLALLEALLADRARLGQRMAAALAAPAAARAHPQARERLTSLVVALLHDDREHTAPIERQPHSFATATIAVASFTALAGALPEARCHALALAALAAIARGPRTAFALKAIARLCVPAQAALCLRDVVADVARAPLVRLAALDTLCALAADMAPVRAANDDLVRGARSAGLELSRALEATDAPLRLVLAVLEGLPALLARPAQEHLEPLVHAWATSALARTDVPASLRSASLQGVGKLHAGALWLAGPLAVAHTTALSAMARDPSSASLWQTL